MILDWLHLDKNYADKLGDSDSIYVESQSDIDEFYWKTLGDIVYREYWKERYKKGADYE